MILKKYEFGVRMSLRAIRFVIKSKHETDEKLSKKEQQKLKEKIKKKELGFNKQANPYLTIVVVQYAIRAWYSYTKDLKDR